MKLECEKWRSEGAVAGGDLAMASSPSRTSSVHAKPWRAKLRDPLRADWQPVASTGSPRRATSLVCLFLPAVNNRSSCPAKGGFGDAGQMPRRARRALATCCSQVSVILVW